jgi:AcrR family transcriptional regulator
MTAVHRGRPPNLERRRAITRAALSLFSEQGYEGCTMSDVAEACGIGKTLVARYFVRKDLLLAAAVDYAHDRVAAAAAIVRTAASRDLALREFLLSAGTIYVRHVEELFGWYAGRLGRIPLTPEQRERLRDAEEPIYAAVAATVSKHGSPNEARVFAQTFLGALQSLVLHGHEGWERSALRRVFLEELVDLLVRGVARDTPMTAHSGTPMATR